MSISAIACARAKSWPISRRRTSINRYPRREAALAQAQGQLGQAQATLEQLIATRDLAEITWQRYKILTADGAVSRQDGDNQSTAAKTSAANVVAQQKTVRATEEFVRASQATLDRLLTLQGYERITAPFDGIITARNVDVGALISATGSSLGPIAIQCRRRRPTFRAEARSFVWRKSGSFEF